MCCCSDVRNLCSCSGGRRNVRRRFFTEDERVDMLKDYIADLENELKAARERLDSLKSGEDTCCC